MSLTTWEFIRGFVQHFLPKRFKRIRHFGILSSQWKKKLFVQKIDQTAKTWKEIWELKGLYVDRCPNCKKGKLIYLSEINRTRGPPKNQTYSNDNSSRTYHAIALA